MAFAFVDSETVGGSGSSITIGSGVAYSTGDLVCNYINRNGTNSITADESGWSEELNASVTSETARHSLHWRVVGAADPSSFGFTFGSSDNYRGALFAFSSATDAEVDSALATGYGGSGQNLAISAIDGAVISDDAVSLPFGGKDNRRPSTEPYTTADNSYTGVTGDAENQAMSGAYRIYTTGTTFSGNVTISSANDPSDATYSAHISFVESVAGGTTPSNPFRGPFSGPFAGPFVV